MEDMMGRNRLSKALISDLRGLRDGNPDSTELLSDGLLSCWGLEWHSRAIAGSAKVCWVVDIPHGWCLQKGFLSELDSYLRWVNAFQTSLNDWLESGRPTLLYSLAQYMWSSDPYEEPEEASIPSYAIVVSAVVLLSLVFHYLTGNVDRGGSKAYSRSSLDFRDIYVAIVLFLGAYVWIKFREAAYRGVHRKELPDKHGGMKVVYEARLKPPMWNGQKVPRLDLGRFTTPQEAHNMFLIAAFYYNRDAGLLDGWFQVPPMSEEELSLTGLEKRKWVIGQAKKVYEDFKKGIEAEAALLPQELREDQLAPEQDEVNVDFSVVGLLNSTEPQQPALASEVENSGMGMAMLDSHGLDGASHSFDGMHEGLAVSNGHSLGCQEGSALPVSQQPPNIEIGMSPNGSDHLDILHTLVGTQQQQISDLQQQNSLQQQQISDLQQQGSLQQQQISDLQQQSSLQQQQISGLQQQSSLQQRQYQELTAQILQMQYQQPIQQQQLLEPRIQNPQWPPQFCLQQQQLQGINQGVPSFEVEMEQSMHQQNYSGFMAPPPDGGEGQEAFSEFDAFMYM